jgi:hypothetical protein
MMTTWSFLEAMLCYPEVQRKAQAELGELICCSVLRRRAEPNLTDKVCPDRLPRWEDLEALPYIKCIMKETWRVS